MIPKTLFFVELIFEWHRSWTPRKWYKDPLKKGIYTLYTSVGNISGRPGQYIRQSPSLNLDAKKITWKETDILSGVNMKHRPTKHLISCNRYDPTHSIYLFATWNQTSYLDKTIYFDHRFTCMFPNFTIFVSDQTDFTMTEKIISNKHHYFIFVFVVFIEVKLNAKHLT